MTLFDEYARIVFATEPGNKNPPKPTRSIQELEQDPVLGSLITDAIEDLCWQHITIERLSDNETTPENLPYEDSRLLRPRLQENLKKFRKLFNIGVFSLDSTIRHLTVIINMRVWNGQQYRPVSEVLHTILPDQDSNLNPSYPPQEYDPLQGMEPGDESP